MAERRGISSFSVLLLMAVAAVVGIACLPRLKVQYTPSTGSSEISVGYRYFGASERTVESEVTSKLEGVLSTIREVSSTRSISHDGGGSVTLRVGRHADLEAVRFEVASQIRNIYSKLPAGCSYPSISLNAHGEKSQTALSYSIRSALPSQKIADFVEREVLYPISTVEGVSSVDFYGQTPFEWVITFDADRANELGITAPDIEQALSDFYEEKIVGLTKQGGQTYGVRLRCSSFRPSQLRPGSSPEVETQNQLASIPVRQLNGRVVHLGDIASFRFVEAEPESYYRVNGLNVLMLHVEVSGDANLLNVVRNVKERVAELQKVFPEEIGISVEYDSSEYIADELDKIYFRTFLCLLILLLFVFAVARSWRYMVVIAITLAVNLLISISLYFFLGLQIHIYTLAGVTVSLGIIIDNSIVMIDHYVRCHDRKVFPSLLCAVFTTVAALLVILLMPEQERLNLMDFSWVIVINLCVSLLVSYLFVPALLDYFPVSAGSATHRPARMRRLARQRARYGRWLERGLRHRWVYWVLLVAMFGIPTCLLPTKFGNEEKEPLKRHEVILNKIVGWAPYADNKAAIDNILSSSFGLFYKAMSRSDFYREPARPQLVIQAGMPEGCDVHQLNQVMRSMENYLAHFDEIDVFETRIVGLDDGAITVWFKPEVEKTWLPSRIKSEIISMATNFGGANWRVSGIDQTFFNNNIISNSRSHRINLMGYNYDELTGYGEQLIAWLKKNRRVSSPEIWGSSYYDRPRTEFNLRYDFESLTARDISPYLYYSALRSPLYDAPLMTIPHGDDFVTARLVSSAKDELDLWHVDNAAVPLGDDLKMKLTEVGEITKGRTGVAIRKQDQSYTISVCFDFVGSGQLADKMIQEAVNWMNDDVLPIGFRAEDNRSSWFYGQKEKYAGLILLVIAIIFVICAIHFNSLRLPLAIILMIPLSFVGLFLAFGVTDFTFDKGGFAAFVMLCGITVNAGIYLVSEWRAEGNYLHAFSRKILPISLTILSTVLGLIPFLFDGPGEVFWFAFAIGTIAGLVFSVLALLFYLPVFVLPRRHRRAKTKSSSSQSD
ncbi:MAG: efflux RND transporter permease subunit [Bacteroidales bacterium]|nr:efflux RND transporter permease subunit [Bacteroidales bacterium]